MSTVGTIRSAEACFTEYVEQAGALAKVAEFCHVRPETVLSWQNGTRPRGEPLYLLWAFLEFQGYKLKELEGLPKPSHQLLLVIASGELSFEDARRELEYANLQSLYRLFLHGSAPTQERVWTLERLVQQHSAVLEASRREPTADAAERSVEQKLGAVAVKQVVAAPQPSGQGEQSSLARLLRLAMKRSGEVEPEELKRQLQDVPPEELEAFALLLLELV